ncbi:MAG: peptidylprolyl isomerase [Myxococcota bacterium]
MTRLARVLLSLAPAFAPAACDRAERGAARGAWTREGHGSGVVIANVDGTAILGSEVARQARLKGSGVRAAADDLVSFELLAAEARRRGLDADAEVRDEARRVAVQRYLAETFERRFTRDDVDEDLLRRTYEERRSEFVHPELRSAVHLLAKASKDSPPGEQAAARALAAELRARARKDTTDAASFRALAGGIDAARLVVENLPPYPFGNLERPFAEALFSTKPGRVADAVPRTSYGYHVVFVLAVDPARNLTFAKARAQVLERVWPEEQARAFERFVTERVAKHEVLLNEALLGGDS